MKPEDWPKVKAVFDSVVLLEAAERSEYLNKSCVGDEALRREVEHLLAAYDGAESFLEKPLAGELADLLINGEEVELEPGQTFGHYQIVRKLGVGGIGKVYLARDDQLKRQVAIKILSTEATSDPEQVSRFVQEARLASLINHPNILTIYEIGDVGSVPFISTEYVSGETLRDRIKRSQLKPEEAVDLAIEVASALSVAHRSGVVHRDIKPENIMVREDGLLKVLDFGMAKLNPIADHDPETWAGVMTQPGLVLGTVSYMSPEQARGIEVDERTDVWSLGVVLYELITGKPPFVGVSRGDVAASIIEVEPDPIDSGSTHTPKRLSQIVKKALAKDVDGRYQTIGEMLDDLKNIRTEIRSGGSAPRSVAILPFVNITGDPRVSFFEFALADAVITELANTGHLMVRPSSAVAKYVGRKVDPVAIGNELNADAILAANFLVTDTRIRVTAQLIDVPNKKVLWGEQIDSEGNDILALQDTITHRIVEGLQCELETADEGCMLLPATSNSLAYVEYLRGRDQLRRYMFHTVANENVDIAIQHFLRAIDLDPNFALAHSALGTCYLQRVLKIFGSRQDLETAAKELDLALALEPRLTDARAYRAFIMRLEGETQRSRDEMAKLRRDFPNYFEVQYLSAACYRFDGDYDRAFACYEEMLRIDPTAQVSVHYCRARIFWYRGRYDLSFDELSRARSIEPNHPIVRFFHAIVTFRSGEPAIAVEQIKRIFATYPCEGFRPYLAICLSALGDFDAARRELTEESEKIAEVDPDVSYWLATAHLMAGRNDEALKWLEHSIFLGNHNLSSFESDPIWMPVHADPRYARLMSGLKHSYN